MKLLGHVAADEDQLAIAFHLEPVAIPRDGEKQVNDVVEKAGIHQSGVSRHLRILFEAGFVKVRPDGQRRYYGLRPEPFRELESWLGRYKRLWDERLDRFGAALEKNQKKGKQ